MRPAERPRRHGDVASSPAPATRESSDRQGGKRGTTLAFPRLMLDVSVLLGVVALLGARAAVAPLTMMLVAAACAFLARRRVPLAWLALAAAVLTSTAWRARAELRRYDAARAEARDALTPPSTCTADAVVASSPIWRGDGPSFLADLRSVSCEGRDAPAHRARLHGGPPDLARGDRLELVAKLAPLQLAHEPDLSDPTPRAALSFVVASGTVVDLRRTSSGGGVFAWIDRARAAVRARIVATYPADAAALGRALVLGEEDLEPGDADAFRQSGLSHLLAVSGAHLVLVVAGMVLGVRALLLRIPALAEARDVGAIAAALGAAGAFVYADFAGASGSAERAAAMSAVVLSARCLGRRSSAVRALGLSLFVLLVFQPLRAFDFSLLLSLSATTGLLLLGPGILARLPVSTPKLVGAPLAATLAATLACAPLLAVVAPSLPILGVVANLLAVPIGEALALPLCLAHAVLFPVPPLERGVALIGGGALLAVRAIARVASSASWSALPVPPPTTLQGGILAVGVVALVVAPPGTRRVRGLLLAAALLVGEGLARRAGAPRDVLRVTMLDVGQGDSALVDLPDGRVMLVDGGGAVGSPVDPGRTVLLPSLRARRRSRVDVAVLSHPHPDHFLGLASALPEVEVGELWDNGQGEDEGAGDTYARMLAGLRARQVPVVRPRALCGRPRWFGAARVDVLAPCPAPRPFAPANDGSIVLRISLGTRAALLVGDAERAEEDELLQARADVRADLLKAGHHGSRTSTSSAFLRAVSPSLVVLSTGVRNRFGHPHPTTMATLRAASVEIARTDRDGAIVWETDGKDVRVTRTRAPP